MKKDENNKKEKEALRHITSMLERLSKKDEEELSSLEKKLLEERGFLKYFLWITEAFNKVGKTVKIISIGTFILVLGIFGFYIMDRSGKASYVYTPDKTIMKSTSYLMKIKDQKTLDELKVHPSIYKKDRLAIGTYLEKTSGGDLVGNNESSLSNKFERLEDYNGTNEVVLGFNFKAEKISVSKPMLCQQLDNYITLDIALRSKRISDKQKANLRIGACIVKVPNDSMYAVYSKELFDNGAFTFVD